MHSLDEAPFKAVEGGVSLAVRPAAPPVDGAANAALVAFLADALGLRQSAIRIRSGETSRLKVLHLSGDSSALMARLALWIGTA